MSDLAFDAISRQAARAVSRRASMLALGGTAMAAVVAAALPALPAEGKSRKRKKGKGKKGKQDVNQLCARQVAQCRTAIAARCSGNSCPVIIDVCCSLLGTCQNSAFWDCVAGSASA